MFTMDFSGKTAIVTGGASGLGKSAALTLAANGANLVVGDLDLAGAQQTAQEAEQRHGVKAIAHQVDIGERAQMAALFDAAKAAFPRVDVVVHIAGIEYNKRIGEAEPAGIENLMKVNILGVDNACLLALQTMREQGGGGRVVVYSSTGGRAPNLNLPHYAMSKAAVINLVQSYALLAAPEGISYNTICPGIIRTPMWERGLDVYAQRNPDKTREQIWDDMVTAKMPTGLPQDPQDISNAMLFLASDLARYITGQSLNVDGGQHMN